MKNKINIYLIEYAINAILRQKYKSIFITTIFTLLIFLLTSIFFITNSIRYELNATLDNLPAITVQNLKAGRVSEIDTQYIDSILEIAGVSDVVARVWGYYYFSNVDRYFSVVGIDSYEEQYKNSLSKIVEKFDLDSNSSMVVGVGVADIMRENYYKDYFNFIKPDGSFKKVYIGGVFDGDTQLESNDMIVMSKEIVREVFDIADDKATDFVVKVANPQEIDMVASKIKLLFPTMRVITSKDLKVSYQNIFDYKSGLFLALFIISLFTFFMIVYDKASGLSSEEKREIGVLKAIGWRIDDILKEKFYEAFIISSFSYLVGVILSISYVYLFQAPLLQDIFVGYKGIKTDFELPFIFDIQTMFLVFFLSVPIYIGATIIPAWRVSILEADEVIR